MPTKRLVATSRTWLVLVCLALTGASPGCRQQVEPDVTNSVGMRFKQIPASALYFGMYEVTQSDYERVMQSNPSEFRGPQHPVERVTWTEAVEFCRRLSAIPDEQAARRVYRLPTETEWELACRAGSTTRFHFGDRASRLGRYAWFADNSRHSTHPVGLKRPNPWGLYDMHGNVWEWCQDQATDHTLRTHRGGSWMSAAERCQTTDSVELPADYRSCAVGFRVVLVSSP